MPERDISQELDKIWEKLESMDGSITRLRENAARSDENRSNLSARVSELSGKVDAMTIQLATAAGGLRSSIAWASSLAAIAATGLDLVVTRLLH